jgi:hypothetical protein
MGTTTAITRSFGEETVHHGRPKKVSQEIVRQEIGRQKIGRQEISRKEIGEEDRR